MNLTIKMAKEIETVFKSRNRIKGNQMVKTKVKAEKGGAEKEAGGRREGGHGHSVPEGPGQVPMPRVLSKPLKKLSPQLI